MKRRLLTIAIFLLLGAVVNVVVAWGCILILLPGLHDEYERMLMGEQAARLVEWPFTDGPTPDQCIAFEERRTGWSEKTVDWGPVDDDPGILVSVSVLSAGWPAYSLLGRFLWELDTGRHEYALMVPDWARPSTGRRRLVEYLPLRPMWPGFVMNTVFFATLLWLPFALRRFLRVRRGLCPKCAYPMGESSVCTECGGVLAKRAVA